MDIIEIVWDGWTRLLVVGNDRASSKRESAPNLDAESVICTSATLVAALPRFEFECAVVQSSRKPPPSSVEHGGVWAK